MTKAVIVSTARTPYAKSFKGGFNITHGATMGGHAIKHAVERAGMRTLDREQRVSYDLETDSRGKTSAVNLQAA